MAKRARKRAGERSRMPTALTLHISPSIRELDGRRCTALLRQAAPALPLAHPLGDLLDGPGARRAALAFAAARVVNPQVEAQYLPQRPGDFEFELAADKTSDPGPLSLLHTRLYDGMRVVQAAVSLIPEDERSMDHVHVWATRRLLVTYSKDDYRYHARYAVHGYPTAFSVPALRYAPAPSKQAAIAQMLFARQGLPPEMAARAVEEQFADENFDPEDPKLVANAFVSATLQACARAAGEEPFCAEAVCRLFNPHRKPEFIASILGDKLCARHAALFGGASR